MFLFPSQIYLKATFYCWGFFILTKNLNIAQNPADMKQNMLH